MDMAQRLDYVVSANCLNLFFIIILLQLEAVGYVKQSMHSYTSLDFCLDEIGKIDWVCYFTGLKELTIVNNSVTEIEVSQSYQVFASLTIVDCRE